MKLMTKEIEKKIPDLYEQDGKGMEAIVYLKLFNPVGSQTWYVTELDKETGQMFGYANLGDPQSAELGYLPTIKEFEQIDVGLGLGIERDKYFDEMTLSEAIRRKA